MNKKFFGLLLVGASLFSVCTLESCKDTNTDLCTEISIKSTKQYEELKARIDALEGKVCSCDMSSIKSQLEALKAEVAALSGCSTCAAEIEALKTAVAAIQTELLGVASQADLSALEARVATLESDYAAVEGRVSALELLVADLQDQITNKVTGLAVQSVYTPAFGSFNTPVGLNSNVLVSYYGDAATALDFNGEMIAGDLMSATAGKLYLTVDPSNVNFENLPVCLVNSNGTNAGVNLSNLKVSDHVITLGYTRANNYLYETTAVIPSKDAVKRISLNTKLFKDAAKDIVSYSDGISLTNLANLVLNTVNNQLDANAVQVTKGDQVLVSKYEIAATAVHPLTFNAVKTLDNFVDDLNIDDKIKDAFAKLDEPKINKAVDKILNKVMPYVDRLPKLANPAMFVKDGEYLRLLSKDPANPTIIDNSNVTLIPSSYSLELVVPYYKKCIMTSDADITVDGANIAGTVVDGCVMEADMNVTTSGVATIKYEVVDYAGKPASRTYYVKVK